MQGFVVQRIEPHIYHVSYQNFNLNTFKSVNEYIAQLLHLYNEVTLPYTIIYTIEKIELVGKLNVNLTIQELQTTARPAPSLAILVDFPPVINTLATIINRMVMFRTRLLVAESFEVGLQQALNHKTCQAI